MADGDLAKKGSMIFKLAPLISIPTCSAIAVFLLLVFFVGIALYVFQGGGGGVGTAIAGPDCLSPAGGSIKILDRGRFIEGLAKMIEEYNKHGDPDNITPDMAEDFVKAGEQYGVNPLILIGEALVESSLGRQAIVCDNGTNTHNSFGRTAKDSSTGCYKGDRYWFIYPSFRESIYMQAEYVARRYVNPPPEGTCEECKDGPLSFSEYLEIYSPAFENDQAQMTKNYNYSINQLRDLGYGDTFSCGTGIQETTTTTQGPHL